MATTKNNKMTNDSRDVSRLVLYVGIIAVALLFQLATFGMGGAFGVAARAILFGLFGIFAYLVPAVIAVGFIYFDLHPAKKKTYIKTGCGIGAWLFLAIIIELFLYGGNQIGGIEAFNVGMNDHIGGGFFGGLLSGLLVHGFGVVGAYIISFALLAIFGVVLTDDISFDSKKNSPRRKRPVPRPKRSAPSKAVRADDKRISEKTDNRKTRFSGIMSNTTLVPEGPASNSDEINEIKYPESEASPVETAASVEPDSNTDTAGIAEIVPESTPITELNSFSDPDEPLGSYTDSVEEPFIEPTTPEPIAKPAPLEESIPVEEAKKNTAKSRRKAAPKVNTIEESMPVGNVAQKAVAPEDDVVIDNTKVEDNYVFPTSDLLTAQKTGKSGNNASPEAVRAKLESVLSNFGVNAKVTDATVGPTVTRYELQPEPGVKVSKIVNLADDIKLNLAAADIRIEAPIPGKAAVGIEVPNAEPTVVSFKELLDSKEFKKEDSKISFAAGKDIGGKPVIANIAKMPHVLIAGATGSGKSVCINTIIMSILFKAHPDDVKFIMIDPKVVELSVYNGIPHLLTPVVTEPKKAAGALAWAVKEMMDRYETFAKFNVRNMEGYNSKIKNGYFEQDIAGEKVKTEAERMPQIVVIVDELADLMMVAAKEVEESICRLAQLARAAGIHLVIATQRPSVNVITGLIKANMPSRIAFAVTSGVDSRTILDMTGAEKLLGKGDMLYFPQGYPKPVRVQGAFVPDGDVAKVADFIKSNNRDFSASEDISETINKHSESISDGATEISSGTRDDSRDAYFEEAGKLLIDKEKGSIGMLQRYFKIGFNRAARIMDQLEEAGVVGPEVGTKPRSVIMSKAEFESSVLGIEPTETEEIIEES